MVQRECRVIVKPILKYYSGTVRFTAVVPVGTQNKVAKVVIFVKRQRWGARVVVRFPARADK
jgi:hypothetical protein